MKRLFLCTLLVVALAAPSHAARYIAGQFNGWDAAGQMMDDLGGGVHQAVLTGLSEGRHEFKVTVGDWGTSWPMSGNSWLFADSFGTVTITYVESALDGQSPAANRIGVNDNIADWTAVGSWQGWDNANPATKMVSQGAGLYSYQQVVAAGTHYYKAVKTGSWDAIGADSRSINADNLEFITDDTNNLVTFYLDADAGTVWVEVVPEPASIFALTAGVGGLLAFRRRL